MKDTTAKRRTAVAHQVVAAQRSLGAFAYERRLYSSQTVMDVMRECERAFSIDKDYDRAEHLVKIIAFLIQREAPKFAADPKKWIELWKGRRELQGLPTEGVPTDEIAHGEAP
jgi:hypothetical protein